MPTQKPFDPTLPRVSTNVPDDIDIKDTISPSSSAADFFADTLSGDGPMPPPLAGEGEPSTPTFADAQEAGAEMIEGVREKLSIADTRVRAFVEERPIVALCGAVVAGFLIGRIVSRI